MKDKDWKKWLFWFSFAVATIIVYKTIDSVSAIFSGIINFLDLLMPFIMAMLVAYMLYIPAKSIEKLYKKSKFTKKHARGYSIFTVYIVLAIIIFVIIDFVIPAASKSIMELAKNIPNYYNSAITFFENMPKDSLVSKLNIVDLIKNLESINISEEISNLLNAENITQYIKGIMGATSVIFDLFVIIVVSIYMLSERDDIKSFVKNVSKAVFDTKTNEKLANYYEKTNGIFFSYISSQILDAFIVGFITMIAMVIMKVKYGVLLGFLIGLFNIIPYFGAIVAVGISIIITIFTGGFLQALWLAIVIIILQQLDANIINPRILGTSLNLSPILVIFAVTVGGAYFGVLGMFLGVPVVALLKTILDDFVENKNKEKKLSEEKLEKMNK